MPRTNVDKVATNYRRFNDFIRGELRRKRLNQEDLANYLNVNRSTLTNRLNGRIEWSLRDAFKAVEFLEADLKEIL